MKSRLFTALLMIFLTSFFAALGCQMQKGVESALINKGVIPLSSTNPYVGANVFLSEEAEKSSYLLSFLQNKSGPQAVSLESGSKMTLYYPALNEKYLADLQQSEFSYEWIIRGPFRLSRKEFQNLRALLNAPPGVLNIHGVHTSFKPTPVPTPQIIIVTPTPRPRKPARVVQNVESTPQPSPTKDFISTLTFPLNSDQQALLKSKGYAERTRTGDLIHTVQPGETLEEIVDWYTKDKKLTDLIQAASGLTSRDEAKEGYQILIPKSLVKESRQKR